MQWKKKNCKSWHKKHDRKKNVNMFIYAIYFVHIIKTYVMWCQFMLWIRNLILYFLILIKCLKLNLGIREISEEKNIS